ncbi:murein hydrolase activator EnvC family protein, partial [Pararhodospirillum oryzae]|uniref:murein hydrolase activator EnvC family protein n=1 Tax=Pararhodospirillum oryzae TaxID=478448 RepID=UPI0011BE01C4
APSAGAAPPAGAAPAPAPAPLVPPPASTTSGRGGILQWPVQGSVLSGFGPIEGRMHNDGINIAAAQGTLVRAAENGVVAYAGNEIRGFGNLLLIKHEGGLMTAYAHNAVLLVERGQTVRRGQEIAKVGSSGGVSRPQLHFEVRKNGKAVDPMPYLKSQKVADLGGAAAGREGASGLLCVASKGEIASSDTVGG